MIDDLKKLQIRTKDDDDESFDAEEDIDDPYDMEDFDPGAQNQDSNKNVFRRNYGVESQLPGFYIIDAKIYPTNLDYVLRVVKYVSPNEGVY